MRRRYVYWIAGEELGRLGERLRRERRTRITPIKGVPCKGFADLVETSFVAPGEWDKVCRRQGGWYRESARAGQYLVVSSDPLEEEAHRLATVVESSDFRPARLPGPREVAELAQCEGVRARAPKGWEDLDRRERVYWGRLLSKIGSDATLDDVLAYHTANHGNFIEPRFFVEGEEERIPIPYSIGATSQVCSACVELFSILGAEFPVKYVMPCPGLVLFAGVPADRYLRVSGAR